LQLRLLARAVRAFPEVLEKRAIGQMFQVLRLREQLPTSVGMICGALSAQRRSRAQAAYGFHSQSPPDFPHLIFSFRFKVIMIMRQN
jgi:hypothetical protein